MDPRGIHSNARATAARERALWAFGLVAMLAMLLGPLPAASSPAPPSEYEVKAAFLYNFAKFTQWPAECFPDSTSAITIGVLGIDPFGAALETAIEGRTAAGRRLAVRRFRSAADVQCHILFISASERVRTGQILAAMRDTPVLTVSENVDPRGRGVMINFVVIDNRVRFEINLRSAERARLTLNSQLLRLSRNILKGGERP
jgi:hypothetical protein